MLYHLNGLWRRVHVWTRSNQRCKPSTRVVHESSCTRSGGCTNTTWSTQCLEQLKRRETLGKPKINIYKYLDTIENNPWHLDSSGNSVLPAPSGPDLSSPQKTTSHRLSQFIEEEEEEEPYLRKMYVCMYVCTMPYLSPFVPLYPTYRSCFKEFRPPIFLRNRYPWYRPKTQEQISSTAEPIQTLHVKLLSQ